MSLKRPVILCAALSVLSAVCMSYKVEFIAYAAAILFAAASVFVVVKSKRSFAILVLCAICVAYVPVFDTLRQISAEKFSKSRVGVTHTAVVENISESYDNATLFLRLSGGKKAILRIKTETALPEIYDTISFSGAVLPLEKNTLEQNKIYGEPFYYYGKGYNFVVVSSEFTNLGRQEGFFGASSIKYKYYYYITDRLKEAFPNVGTTDNFSYIRALLTGERTGIDDGIYRIYRESGLAPFLCISGLHVVVASAFLSKILEKLHLNKSLGLFINLLFLFFISTISGSGGSVVRACIMSAVFSVCNFFETKADRLSVLGISFMLIFLNNPYCVFDYGTRLSYLAMLGIICASFVTKIYSSKKNVSKNALTVGFFAMGFTLPIIVYDFGGVYLLSPFSNATASVFFTPLMYIIVAVAFLGFLPQMLLKIMAIPAMFLLKLFELCAKAFCAIPFSYAEISLPQPVYAAAGVVFFGFLFACAFCSERRIFVWGTLFCVILLPAVLIVHFMQNAMFYL